MGADGGAVGHDPFTIRLTSKGFKGRCQTLLRFHRLKRMKTVFQGPKDLGNLYNSLHLFGLLDFESTLLNSRSEFSLLEAQIPPHFHSVFLVGLDHLGHFVPPQL